MHLPFVEPAFAVAACVVTDVAVVIDAAGTVAVVVDVSSLPLTSRLV